MNYRGDLTLFDKGLQNTRHLQHMMYDKSGKALSGTRLVGETSGYRLVQFSRCAVNERSGVSK